MDALYLLALVVSSVLIIVYQFSSSKHKKLPPGPPAIPIVGHFYLLKKSLHDTLTDISVLENLSKKYGPIFLLRFGSRPTLVLTSRSAIEECFPNNDIVFSNRPLLPSKRPLEFSNHSLGAPYGDDWRNIRRFSVIEIFSARPLQMSSEIRAEEIKLMIKHLYQNISNGVNEKVDLRTFFYFLAFNIQFKMITGKRRFEDHELDSDVAKLKLYDLADMFSPNNNLVLSDCFPFLRWLTYFGEARKIHKVRQRSDAFMQSLLDEHQDNSVNSKSTIDVMLKFQESEPEVFTNGTIKGIIRGLLIGGTHSSALISGWVVSQLIANPAAFHKAREEIDKQVGNSRLMNETDLPKLPYLHGIINETLRLSPVGVFPTRESSEDCTVGGYHIPRGTQLLMSLKAVHMDPDLWPEPEAFKPERFLQENVQEKGKIKFIAFGIGRRMCPGEGLGMRVLALSIGTLIQCFDWEDAVTETKGRQKPNLINPAMKSIEVIFRPREELLHVLAQV